MILAFGKHKGKSLEDVPLSYLWFLTCWELEEKERVSIWHQYLHDDDRSVRVKVAEILNEMDPRDDDPTCEWAKRDRARLYVVSRYPKIVWAARALWKSKRVCDICRGPLMPFRVTTDWSTRSLHKKCYLA
jgi:hypothetical protein